MANIDHQASYEKRKRAFDDLITIFGRKPVREALSDPNVTPVKLHLADSNKSSDVISELNHLAESRGVPVAMHDRIALSRISKNGRQDQGVALDVQVPTYRRLDAISALGTGDVQLIALDGITNPQNLGLVIRSVGASPCDGLILPRKGCAPIDALVIKASAGTVFKAPIFYCDEIVAALVMLKSNGFGIFGLAGDGDTDLSEVPGSGRFVFVLGNETYGLSSNVRNLCDDVVGIRLANNVESLNVSAAATVVAFRRLLGC